MLKPTQDKKAILTEEEYNTIMSKHYGLFGDYGENKFILEAQIAKLEKLRVIT